VAEGKGERPAAASPIEVARTLLARAREGPAAAIHDPGGKTVSASAGQLPTKAQTRSGVRPTRRGVATVAAPTEPDKARSDATSDDRYVTVGELGRGGMGRVDEVFDRVLGRPVALKAVLPGADEARAAMLVGEAQTCAQLEHPAIVPVYDLDAAEDGQPFYTMRVVHGRTLRDVLDDNLEPRRAQTPLTQVLGVFRQVCLAVDYAHTRGVVHRDLKPENVIVGEFGEVYVVDWGIAHLVEGSSVKRAELAPVLAGTPAYMAPEQVVDGAVDARTDVFALGVMLYEILAGTRPFGDDSIKSVRARRTQTVDSAPSARDPERSVPTAFDGLVLACLSPTPKGRPGRARVLAAAIDEFTDGERDRAERAKEARAYSEEGRIAWQRALALEARGRELEAQAASTLSEMKPWVTAEGKQPLWDLEAQAQSLRSEAATARAQAETAFGGALGRIADHAPARKGLAAIYFEQFLAAERAEDSRQMAQYLDLARAYDDGALALELADEGELLVAAQNEGAEIEVARYQARGPRLVLEERRGLGVTPTRALMLRAGSYLLSARSAGRELRYPVVIGRARRQVICLRFPGELEIPEGFVLIPGGPFASRFGPSGRLLERTLPDFAIARLPVRIRDYVQFLDALDPAERDRHMPAPIHGDPCIVREAAGKWRTGSRLLEGKAKKLLDGDRQLDLPIVQVTWRNAMAYAEWLAEQVGRPLRLPTALEWEKAARGADGRPYPMGVRFDPAFAKTRDSRKEVAQPEPVGAFPLDESPYGVRDLAGGVGDWTITSIEGGELTKSAQDTPTGSYARQVYWCGGTWSSSRPAPEMRYAQSVDSEGGWIGFRLVLPLDEHGSSELTSEPMTRK
jgi:eukaryotic-like serine/threonine-protein kinase